MAAYIKGDAVANAKNYILYEKIAAGTSLGDEVEYLADWQRSAGSFGNTNFFSQKNRFTSKTHIKKFCYYNGGEETITAKLIIYDSTSMTVTKVFTFSEVVSGANQFDVDFDMETTEDWIVQVSKDSYWISTPSGYTGLTMCSGAPNSVGATVTLGSAFTQYTLPANLIGNEYVETSGETYEERATASGINFSLDDLVLPAGDHTFVVKAKADGYEDSDYSNAVTYTVA